MTTDPTRPVSPREPGTKGPSGTKPQLGSGLTSMELRFHVITVLAAVYLVSWRVITAGSAPPADPPPPPMPSAPAIPRQDTPASTARIDGVARRPWYTVPAGWHVVDWDSVRALAPRKLERAPASRPVRVRTRSS